MIQQSHYGHFSKRIEIRILKRCLHCHVHCGTIHSSQVGEQPKCLLMDEQMKGRWWTAGCQKLEEKGNERLPINWCKV